MTQTSDPGRGATLQSYLDGTPVARGRLVAGRMSVDEVFDPALWDRFVQGRFALDIVVDDGGQPRPVFAALGGATPAVRTWVAVHCRACNRRIGEWAPGAGDTIARFRCCRCKARTIVPWPPPSGVPGGGDLLEHPFTV